MKQLLLVLLLLLLLLPGLAWAQDRRDEDPVFHVSTGDPEMQAAIARARASLDEFLRIAAAQPAGTEDFKLKVAVRDRGLTEHFWVNPFRVTQGGFEGELANEPRVVRNVRYRQTIRFTREQVSDWGYRRNGREVGSFTVCVLLGRMPPAQAEQIRRENGFDCPGA
jgi:uncharacterized protein YegJ (DUF2314 family)